MRELNHYGKEINVRMNRREKRSMELPQDANILLSYVNLKLRDFYSSLDAMCEDLDESRAQIEEKLSGIGYGYDPEKNQFVSCMS